MKKITLGYCGMTHLGLLHAVAAAGKGFDVVGYDPFGIIKVIEPGLDEALEQRSDKLNFTQDLNALKACDIVYIAPDVATNDQGQSDLTVINSLLDKVIPALNSDALLVILSQVSPGFTRLVGFPKSRLFYQVETLIFGRALERAEYPERFIIGCHHPNEALPLNFKTFLESFDCPILPMRYESAELAKIAINCCLVASISVANTLGELCENIGADWHEIVPALRLDKRIGPYAYLNPGLGISGGNLERDLATIVNMASQHGTDKGVIKSFINNSVYRKNWPLKVLHQQVLQHKPDAKIAVWGLTYKENTHSLKNSPAIQLLSDLQEYDVSVYDPVIKQIDLAAKIAASPIAALQDADVLVIMTPWQDFREVDVSEVAQKMAGKTIIDPFGVLAQEKLLQNDIHYYALGKSTC